MTFVMYADESSYSRLAAPWTDTIGADDKRYVVQTNSGVVRRCLLMTTDPGDLVFDPTCGAGTTAYVAEAWGRRWVACDTSRVAVNVTRSHLHSRHFDQYRTRNGAVASGFQYKKARRITLTSLANDLEATEIEMRDQPEVDTGAIRVCGPFEVMSLGRYSMEDWKGYVSESGKLANYIEVICRLYRRDAAVQGSSGLVHAISESDEEKIAISVGPVAGRVTGKQVNDAVQDALASGILEVHVLGWAFEANVGEIKSQLESRGKVKIELVMIRPDTLAEGLKVTQPEMLFSPLGIPGIQVDVRRGKNGPEATVRLEGLAIFDRKDRHTDWKAADSGYISAWYLDEDYDGDCFVDCQMFFDFKKAPNLKSTLKAEVDPEEFKFQAALKEGWDVKSVTHILGLRAFGSPLLTEQVIGRGLRRTSYDGLLTPIEERLANDQRPDEETVDAFGIPFIGFPVEKRRRRPRAGVWGQKPVPIEPDSRKEKYAIRVPNVRSWAVGVTRPLRDSVDANGLPELVISPNVAYPEVPVRPVVGSMPEEIITLDRFRQEYPLLRSKFIFARELFEATNPGGASDILTGPTFDELLELASDYVDRRVRAEGQSDRRDIGIYHWTQRGLNVLETAIRQAPVGTAAVPILGQPEYLDSRYFRRRTWTGVVGEGRKCHLSKVPCHTDLEASFSRFLDAAPDVVRYIKNEFFGFSLTYYENNRPRQYFPDFIVLVRGSGGRETWWLAETKGEIRPNTPVKREAADLWCEKMSAAGSHGSWRHLFAPQRRFEQALAAGVKTFAGLSQALVKTPAEPQLRLVETESARLAAEKFKSLLPVYSLKAAAGYFGSGEAVEAEGWVEVDGFGALDEAMFVARAIGRSMEPRIHDGDYCVFRAKPTGTRQGKIVLAQYRGPADPETGGAFTIKRYRSEKVTDADGSWKHGRIVLEPLNASYEPIGLSDQAEGAVRVIAEFLGVLKA